MALAFGVSELIFGHIHYKSRDRADRCICAGAGAWFVLLFLVVRFPAQTEIQAGLTTFQSVTLQAVHLVLFHTATYGESTVCNQHGR